MAKSPETAGPEEAGPTTGNESLLTVIVAGGANLAIAIAKAAAGLATGSGATMSEAAHSVADTTTEVMLFAAVHRGRRPPDARHPFGYGKEFYVWAFLAAIFTFLAGAGFSFLRGYRTLVSGEHGGDYRVALLVLGVAFVIESLSLARALWQLRRTARRVAVHPVRLLRITSDTALKAVTMEDIAALIGLLLAGVGVGLTHLTGRPIWDALGSFAIGALLIVVAGVLARSNMSLLVGQAVPHRVRTEIYQQLCALPTVRRVHTLLTMQLGPHNVLVAAKVDFDDNISARQIEYVADEAERRLTARYPTIRYVFLDPTRSRPAPSGNKPHGLWQHGQE